MSLERWSSVGRVRRLLGRLGNDNDVWHVGPKTEPRVNLTNEAKELIVEAKRVNVPLAPYHDPALGDGYDQWLEEGWKMAIERTSEESPKNPHDE